MAQEAKYYLVLNGLTFNLFLFFEKKIKPYKGTIAKLLSKKNKWRWESRIKTFGNGKILFIPRIKRQPTPQVMRYIFTKKPKSIFRINWCFKTLSIYYILLKNFWTRTIRNLYFYRKNRLENSCSRKLWINIKIVK